MKSKFLKELHKLKYLLNNKPTNDKKHFGISKIDIYQKDLENSLKKFREVSYNLGLLHENDNNKIIIYKILQIVESNNTVQKIDKLIRLGEEIKEDSNDELKIKIPKNNFPTEIQANLIADFKEIEKTYNSGCYRACTILCGRILEICLHRKYYDTTGIDLLEKSPGIGLGKLIAKLSDKDVFLDPGITQQIHLVNQIRIHSVHIKKIAFNPSKQQTHAMILYTLDILKKMY